LFSLFISFFFFNNIEINYMVKKLGILGCQSKHAEFFGSLFNTEKAFPGYQVHYLFGDNEPERLPYVQRTAVMN